MKILILGGSIGQVSCTRTLLRYAQSCFTDHSIDVIWWDLGEKPLPIAIPEYHDDQYHHPKRIVRQFAAVVDAADGFILGSPLYHDSYSGVLKNALDTLPNKGFRHKPVGLMSHSSNARSCVTPCNQLRPVVRSLAGYATQQQIGTTDKDYSFNGTDITLASKKVKGRMDALVDEIIALSNLFETIEWKQPD